MVLGLFMFNIPTPRLDCSATLFQLTNCFGSLEVAETKLYIERLLLGRLPIRLSVRELSAQIRTRDGRKRKSLSPNMGSSSGISKQATISRGETRKSPIVSPRVQRIKKRSCLSVTLSRCFPKESSCPKSKGAIWSGYGTVCLDWTFPILPSTRCYRRYGVR